VPVPVPVLVRVRAGAVVVVVVVRDVRFVCDCVWGARQTKVSV
jgi:hypothetical protein